MKVLLDTNIILDIALKREPFFEASNSIFLLINIGLIEPFITASSITDIYYLVNKNSNHIKTINFIKNLLQIVTLLPTDSNIIYKALDSNFKDFEDAIQSITADINSIELIITRNINDFKNSKVKAITPNEFLLSYK